MTSKSILFVVPYLEQKAPSQRFRVEQFYPLLEQHGYSFETHSFFHGSDAQVFYGDGNAIRKLSLLIIAWWRRIFLLLRVGKFDYVFIHREAAPAGPPFFEWMVARVLNRKVIFDLDDAIWLTDKVGENGFEKIIRWRSKVTSIAQWSYKVSCGNNYLVNYVSQFNNHVVYNPTVLDTVNHFNPALFRRVDRGFITVGWTGSYTTLKYFNLLEDQLLQLEQKYPQLRFLVIADQPPQTKLNNISFVRWSTQQEVSALLEADIGIMPLPDDEWSKGKCGFKALQYMSLEIPTVAAAVGANLDIIQHETNGLIARTDNDWVVLLDRLINDAGLRKKLGTAGRDTVERLYSVNSNSSTFLSLFT